MRFSRNISKYNLRVSWHVCFILDVMSLPVCRWRVIPGSLSRGNITQSGSSIRHALTTIRRNRNSLSTCAMRCIRNNDRPDVPLFGENTKVCQYAGAGGGEKYSISNISHSPPFSSSTLGEISSIIFSQRVHANIVKFISWSIEIKSFTIGLI